jgi:transcriptional regulator with XRE-family HTH domain
MTGAPKCWFELMDELRGKAGLSSQDDVAYEARRHGAPSTLTGSWISQLRKGSRPLAPDVLRGIAGALGIEPERFAEYRLAVARQQLDERAIGLEQAVANLRALEDMVTEEGLPGPPDGELARLLKGEPPSKQDRQRSDSKDRAPSARRKRGA